MLKFVLAAVALTLAGAAQASLVDVDAYLNSTSGGTGAFALNLTAGEAFSVTVDPNDLWNAGALPRWSNANGLTGDLYYTVGTDSQVPVYAVGTLIGTNFGLFSENGLTAPFGTLVGQIGSGNFFAIGTNYSGVAATSGALNLYYFDSNYGDNTGSILANVSAAVPEPESYALLGAGLLAALLVRRKRTA